MQPHSAVHNQHAAASSAPTQPPVHPTPPTNMPEKRARPREPASPNTTATDSAASPPSPSPEPHPHPHPPRPKESSDESPTPKRRKPSEEPPKPRKSAMLEIALQAYNSLRTQHADRADFKAQELLKAAETVSGIRRGSWRKQFTRILNTRQYFLKVAGRYRPTVPDDRANLADPAVQDAARASQEEVYRPAVPVEWTQLAQPPVTLSTFDKSVGVKFVGDAANNVVQGYKGYRMVRATSGVCEGDWYFECQVMPFDGDGAVRFGWSMRRSDAETPVGFDAYGFGIRDRTGEFVHRARLKPYGEPFAVGDVIGCRIVLPKLSREDKDKIAKAESEWLYFRFVQQLQGYMVAPPDSGVDILANASVQFYKNGRHFGVPELFKDKESNASSAGAAGKTDAVATGQRKEMRAGVYYPSVALFGNARAKANFGPQFRYDMPEGSRAMCEAAAHALEEKAAAEAEARAKETAPVVAPKPAERPGESAVGAAAVEVAEKGTEVERADKEATEARITLV